MGLREAWQKQGMLGCTSLTALPCLRLHVLCVAWAHHQSDEADFGVNVRAVKRFFGRDGKSVHTVQDRRAFIKQIAALREREPVIEPVCGDDLTNAPERAR